MPSLWSSVPTLLLLPTSIAAATFDCKHVRADHQSFHLDKLGGPKQVHQLQSLPPRIHNTTFSLDICRPIKYPSGVDRKEKCEGGTWICAVDQIDEDDGTWTVSETIPIAGQYQASNGRTLDPEITRLKGSGSHSDSQQEGIRVELHGGKYPDTRKGVMQKAIIEFICDPELTGNEGFEDDALVDHLQYGGMQRRADNAEVVDDDQDLPNPDEGKSLQVVSYMPEDEYTVLRLTWKTKYACENAGDDDDDDDDDSKEGKKSSGWGFFTWFLIILFLLAAAYIIFGSWLNYNRYGARGWDLIPHSDTIRDLPYIIKDWGTGIVSRLRGGGSRGGYSAV